MKLELIIDGKNVDLFGDEPINLTYSIADIRSIFTRDTTFSQNFKLPGTANNNQLFSHLFDIKVNSTTFDPNQTYKSQLYKDGVLILDGWFQLMDVEIDDLNREYIYNGTLTDYIYNFYNNIKDKTLVDINWFKNNTFPQFSGGDQYLDYLESNWNLFTTDPNNTHYTFPLVDLNHGWIYDELTRNNPIFAEQLPIAIRAKKIVDEIFKDAGYQYSSNFFNSNYFKNLIILSPDNGQMTINYNIKLNLFFDANNAWWYNDTDYYIQFIATSLTNPEGRIIHEEVNTKYKQLGGTENKTIFLNGTANVYSNEVLKVKVICDPTLLPGGGSFKQYIYIESGSTMEVKYIEPNFSGYTFKVQTDYIQKGDVVTGYPPSTANGPAGITGSRKVEWWVGWTTFYAPSPTNYIGQVIYNYANLFDTVEGYFSVTPQPELTLYLPDNIKQSDFLVWLVQMFNLYIDWDNINERIIIEPREDYLLLNDKIRDWTNILDISKSQNIRLVNENQPRNYLFTYTEDDDDVNKLYSETFNNEVYGQYSYIFDKKTLLDFAKIQVGFSPTPLGQMKNSNEIIIPQIYKEEREDTIEFKPRLLYWNGLQRLQTESIWINSDLPMAYSSTFDPTAKFNATITASTANNYSSTFLACTSSCQFQPQSYRCFNNLIYTINFGNDTLSSPNFNISTDKFTAINQGNYDFYILLRPELQMKFTSNSGGVPAGYAKVKFYLSQFNSNNVRINQYFIGFLELQDATTINTFITTNGVVDLNLTNISMNSGDYFIAEVGLEVGDCYPAVDITVNISIPSGYWLSVNNTIQTSNVRRYNYYPYASELVGNIGQETETIMFGEPQITYYSSSNSNGYPNLGLYKKYWSGYLYEIQSSESKIYTAFFKLTQEDISTFKYNDLIYIDGSYYRINKIFYNATSDDTTKVELLKLDTLLQPIENQNVIKPFYRLTNTNNFNLNLGNKNEFAGNVVINGNNNSLLRTSNSIISGNDNTILGNSTNLNINGNSNIITNGASNINIIGSDNTVSLSNVTILNGSNNVISETNELPLTGYTATTTTYPTNITLIGVSNYTGTPQSNSVIVPNLSVQGGIDVDGFDFKNINNNDGSESQFLRNFETLYNDFYFTSQSNTYINDIQVQCDGKILVGGAFTNFNGNNRSCLIRFNKDGTEDTLFYNNIISNDFTSSSGSTGFTQYAEIYKIKILNDGKILIAGNWILNDSASYLNPPNCLVKLNSNGIPDKIFNDNVLLLNFFYSSQIFSFDITNENKILVGGLIENIFYSNYTLSAITLCDNFGCLNSDGTFDDIFNSNLGTGFNEKVKSIIIQSNNKILIGGEFNNFNGNTRNFLVRLNPDGTEDINFYNNLGTGFNDTVQSIITQSDGKILIAGYFTNFNGNIRNGLVRLNPDGTEDIDFYNNLGTGFGFNATVKSIITQSDGKILIAGYFNSFNGNTRNGLVRLNSNGIEDTLFNDNLNISFNNNFWNATSVLNLQINGLILFSGFYNNNSIKLLAINNQSQLNKIDCKLDIPLSIPELQLRVGKWDPVKKCNTLVFHWNDTGDNRWKDYQPEIWLFKWRNRKKKASINKYKASRWVHPVDYQYSANTATYSNRNDISNKINFGSTDRPFKTEWPIQYTDIPFFPFDPTATGTTLSGPVYNQYSGKYYYNVPTFLDWTPMSHYNVVIDNGSGTTAINILNPSLLPFDKIIQTGPNTGNNNNIYLSGEPKRRKYLNFQFRIVIRDPNNPNKIIYGPPSKTLRVLPSDSVYYPVGLPVSQWTGLRLSVKEY